MKIFDTCTLVLEFNYTRDRGRGGRGTVWLFAGDGRLDLGNESPLEELPGWARLAGPIDYELAGEIHSQLKNFFQASGIVVIDEGIAD